MGGTETQDWLLCDILALFYISWIHKPHKLQKYIFLSAQHLLTILKIGCFVIFVQNYHGIRQDQFQLLELWCLASLPEYA